MHEELTQSMTKPGNSQCGTEETGRETITDNNSNAIPLQQVAENKGFCSTYSVQKGIAKFSMIFNKMWL